MSKSGPRRVKLQIMKSLGDLDLAFGFLGVNDEILILGEIVGGIEGTNEGCDPCVDHKDDSSLGTVQLLKCCSCGGKVVVRGTDQDKVAAHVGEGFGWVGSLLLFGSGRGSQLVCTIPFFPF